MRIGEELFANTARLRGWYTHISQMVRVAFAIYAKKGGFLERELRNVRKGKVGFSWSFLEGLPGFSG